ncbi:4-hydroxythreonine-4-phosphate dehydrogenase PdxA [Roseobacter sp. YSTF-M11]|uniref:4-hydroxythreonine-4-phosphate dehydrogenase n=1 Tax=Roseobacter insulae TaxID=2859783 RepID=A0A9X1K222_9RHOB|nr:4-hydroxythreonine-4-phosphate dehydrogenase PdxA [Roseobacter insulae]MBW4708088.1 4-hydroxythreonine-4-phosphate dehydrogenase PdxA [Roseobacter insulae]
MTSGAAPVLISCGEPAGIGPEIAAKAWAHLSEQIPLAWMGDPRHLTRDCPYQVIANLSEAADVTPHALPVLAHAFPKDATPGAPDPANAHGVIDVIAQAVALVQSGEAAALCTAPIHKKALIDGAGFAYPGHTEYLAALAGGARAVMMLASDQLRVVPATIHIALQDVPTALTPGVLRDTIEITARSLRDRFGIETPRLAIAGLNPHAGEGGAMGREELDWITALIDRMRDEGLALLGPLPADTMFHAAARKRYDAAIAMYHDQALIPIKTLDFDKGVNVTLGLPFVRTSPDHGTAFDIAGKGMANATSMIEALKLAARMSERR